MLQACFILALLSPGYGGAEDTKPQAAGFVERTYRDPAGKEYKYHLFIPHKPTKEPLPLILFLHGAGERTGGGKKPVEVGLGPAIKKYGEKDFPFVVIFPQADRSWRHEQTDAKRALAILDEVMKALPIDDKRVYLTGMSMGGYGTWGLAWMYPQRWAAIVPICGGGDPKVVAKIKDMPCWCFHGAEDKIVVPERSRVTIKALQEAGGKPKYTEYPGVGHNSWDAAYSTRELYDWLLQHRRP